MITRSYHFFRTAISESKSILSLAIPVMLGQVGHMMFGLADNLMVGRLGAENLAAASIANGIFFTIQVIGMGLTFSLSPITSAVLGSGKPEKSGDVLLQGLIVTVPFSLIISLLIILASQNLDVLQQAPEVTRLAKSYLIIIGVSVIPLMLFQTYRQFIEGLGFTRPGMAIIWSAILINVFGNYCLIYGKMGFPELGLNGAGWATLSSRIFMMVVLIVFVHRSSVFKKFNIHFHSIQPDWIQIRHILKIGLSSGLQYWFETTAFVTAAVIIGWIGAEELAAHQVAMSMASITYMAATGVSAAASIRTGFYFGQKDRKMIRFTGFQCVALVAVFMTTMGILFIMFRTILPTFYIENQHVVEVASGLLIIAAIFQISDGVQVVGLGILRGLQDSKFPTFLTFFSYWIIGLPIGYLLGFTFGYGVYGVWLGLLFGLTASAILLTLRFNYVSKELPEKYENVK